MTELENKLALLEQRVNSLEKQLNSDISEIKGDIKYLLLAWNTGTGLVKFIKWGSSIVIGCVGMYWVGVDIIKRLLSSI